MTAPKVTLPPSMWNTHQVNPQDWHKSLKAELEQIERQGGRPCGLRYIR